MKKGFGTILDVVSVYILGQIDLSLKGMWVVGIEI